MKLVGMKWVGRRLAVGWKNEQHQTFCLKGMKWGRRKRHEILLTSFISQTCYVPGTKLGVEKTKIDHRVFLPPSCPQSRRRQTVYLDVNSEIFSRQERKKLPIYRKKKCGASFFLSSHSPPSTFLILPKTGWVSLTLEESIREPKLGCRSKPYSPVNFTNKVYIFISICLTTVSYFSIDSEFNRGIRGVLFLLVFTESNMIQAILLQKYVQSIENIQLGGIDSICGVGGWVCAHVHTHGKRVSQERFTERGLGC